MKKLSPLVLLCLLAGACGIVGSDDALGEMSVERAGEDGTVSVVRDGETSRVTERFSLEPGDVLTTSSGAQAKLRLEGDRTAWIAGGSRARIAGGDTIENEGGSVLADAKDPMTVTYDDVQATSSNGLFRVDRRPASGRVGVYSGSAALDVPGRTPTKVKTYFQSAISAGDVLSVEPYRVDAGDPWDGLWLEDVVQLDNELRQLAAGFSAQVGRSRPRLEYFRGIAQGENVGFMDRFLKRRPADLLISFTIASNDSKKALPRSFSRAFELRDAGAVWGLVATIMQVPGRATVASLEDLIADSGAGNGGGPGFSFAAGGGDGDGDGPAGPAGGDVPETGGGDDDGTGDDGNGDGDGDGDGDDDGNGGGGGGDECDNIVDCIVEDPPVPLPSLSPGSDIDI